MNRKDLDEMVRLGILDNEGDEFSLSAEFVVRMHKLRKGWTRKKFASALALNKKVSDATTQQERQRVVDVTQVLISFFIQKGELLAMMKRNDLTIKQRMADYYSIVDLLLEERDEKAVENIIGNQGSKS